MRQHIPDPAATADDWPVPNKNIDYDKGENRRKHNGVSKQAAIIMEFGKLVGKCPRGFNLGMAQSLVQNAIPEYRNRQPDKPFRLWNYYQGAIYVAYRTDPGGRTWHGFPAHDAPPKHIKKALMKRARQLGEEPQAETWLGKKWPLKP